MTASAAEAAATAACRRIVASAAFAQAGHVAAYVPTDHELDPRLATAAARAAGKCVYYPRTSDGELEFLAADPETFVRGALGIPEPQGGAPLPEAADVLFLVPGVGFDVLGNRLGRGGGHYDRALRARAGARLALAFEFQVLPRLPEGPWDVRMHAVATDVRFIPGSAP
jgi:5-formyltetrahydrofolate cyclo-ligase